MGSKENMSIVVFPVQCNNNIYMDKILDSLRIEESCNGKKLINYNKNGSIDKGPYQHNSKYEIYFADTYNCGKRYNPFNEEISRNITRQILFANLKITGNMFDALVAYNCGITKWKTQAPYKSFLFAERIIRRIK
jgi:hypothetical protein